MMTVPMDNSMAPSSRELAERLYKKNIELETTLRKFAKSRVPSDPNTWFQIRENYEAIILEDHDFSEKHEIELALWQLHYRRIEEFRTLLNNAKSSGLVTTEGGRTPPRPDSIKKIRSGFKTFLSESTGFYHDLLLKIRAKFGFPLGHFSDGHESQITMTKDEKKSAVMKKGLMSCHRSLIYLGDLARYKGSYGEGDSVSREYAAASSYYAQAASLCPSSGNPHHQLAILASYSGDELVSIYRYFRSLAADIPFSTARDNLIIAFEKNRQSFSHLPGNPKVVAAKVLPARAAGRGRGRGDCRLLSKDSKSDATPAKDCEISIPELLKSFATRFVRVNGILFTRTSLETFGEAFSLVKSDLVDLLSSGPEEELNFGQDAAESGIFIVRLIAILIFTVHNVNRESDGQSYAEILQRTVLLQNAFTIAFEFAGHIIKRCVQLRDAVSSFLLPAILVFIEWLACHPDIAAGSDVEEKQASVRSFFWNQCVAFMNKLLSTGLVSSDGDGDETCFFDMSQYDEGETGNRLALLEDFELRGFLPLVPAQSILDFSRKHSYGSEKERQARVQRLFAAGRALMNVVRVDQKAIYFDHCLRRFMIGIEPSALDVYMCAGLPEAPKLNVTKQASAFESNLKYGITQQQAQVCADVEDDEEEEIVFKPAVGEKYPNTSAPSSMATSYEIIQAAQTSTEGEWAPSSMSSPCEMIQPAQTSAKCEWAPNSMSASCQTNNPAPQTSMKGEWPATFMSTAETIQPAQFSSRGEWANYGTQISTSVPPNNFPEAAGLHTSSQLDAAAVNFSLQPLPHVNVNTSKWLMEQAAVVSNGLKNLKFNGNGILPKHGPQEGLNYLPSAAYAFAPSISSAPMDPIGRSSGCVKISAAIVSSTMDAVLASGVASEGLTMKPSGALQNSLKKTPVGRPLRHLGPPPGFSSIPAKQLDDFNSESLINGQNPQIDDYRWLDGYQSSSTKALGMENKVKNAEHRYQHPNTDTTTLNGALIFPFPGKQISTVQTQAVNDNFQAFQLFDQSKPNLEQLHHRASVQPSMMLERKAESLWSGYFVEICCSHWPAAWCYRLRYPPFGPCSGVKFLLEFGQSWRHCMCMILKLDYRIRRYKAMVEAKPQASFCFNKKKFLLGFLVRRLIYSGDPIILLRTTAEEGSCNLVMSAALSNEVFAVILFPWINCSVWFLGRKGSWWSYVSYGTL